MRRPSRTSAPPRVVVADSQQHHHAWDSPGQPESLPCWRGDELGGVGETVTEPIRNLPLIPEVRRDDVLTGQRADVAAPPVEAPHPRGRLVVNTISMALDRHVGVVALRDGADPVHPE